jgi:hypothetical protein
MPVTVPETYVDSFRPRIIADVVGVASKGNVRDSLRLTEAATNSRRP